MVAYVMHSGASVAIKSKHSHNEVPELGRHVVIGIDCPQESFIVPHHEMLVNFVLPSGLLEREAAKDHPKKRHS